eukprot:scpid101657/ scgid6567/ 
MFILFLASGVQPGDRPGLVGTPPLKTMVSFASLPVMRADGQFCATANVPDIRAVSATFSSSTAASTGITASADMQEQVTIGRFIHCKRTPAAATSSQATATADTTPAAVAPSPALNAYGTKTGGEYRPEHSRRNTSTVSSSGRKGKQHLLFASVHGHSSVINVDRWF